MKKIRNIITRFPFITFVIALVIILVTIVIGSKMRAPGIDDAAGENAPKSVAVFDATEGLYAEVSAAVDRADTIVLRATASGIVTRAVKDGATVYRGTEIVKLSDTYSGATSADAAAAVAQRSAQYQDAISGTQHDVFRAQDKQINKADDRAAKIARKQVFLSERAAAFAFDSAKLQASQAWVAAAAYRTVAPLAGRVEEVRVRVGDTVNRGDIVAVLRAEGEKEISFVAYVGAQRAAHVDVVHETKAVVAGKEIAVALVHIAASGAGGQSYALTYRASKELFPDISDGSFVTLKVPFVGEDDLLIPLDSVRYGTHHAEVYVIEDGMARARTVGLGDVIGSFVIVKEGLRDTDQVILDRTVTDGEAVHV